MIAVNLNSRIVNESTDTDALITRWKSFRQGWDMFAARYPVSVCTNSEQARGWYAALDSEAVAQLPATCAEKLGF